MRVIRRDDTGGPAAARNTGIDAASGSVVAFLDDDDRFTPDRLDLAAQGLEHADIALCWTRWSDDAEGTAGGRRLDGDVSDHILDATTPHLGATAVRADRLVRFDETYPAVEDVEWWLRMAAGSSVATVPRVGCVLRRHGGERANDTDVASRFRCSGRLLDHHAAYFRSHPVARAFRLAPRAAWPFRWVTARRRGRRTSVRSERVRTASRCAAWPARWRRPDDLSPGVPGVGSATAPNRRWEPDQAVVQGATHPHIEPGPRPRPAGELAWSRSST